MAPPLSSVNVLNLWTIPSHHEAGFYMMETQRTPPSQEDVILQVTGSKCNLLLYLRVGVSCRIFKLLQLILVRAHFTVKLLSITTSVCPT